MAVSVDRVHRFAKGLREVFCWSTKGLELERMPLGTRIQMGPSAIVELTRLRTLCVLIDRFRSGLKWHVISSIGASPPFRCGVMGVVRTGGAVLPGDAASVSRPEGLWTALPPL